MQNHAKILWTTDNKDTALNMICLYAHNAKKQGWIENVTILIWGASQTLVSQDKEIQETIKAMINDGVEVIACKACAEKMGVSDSLQSCGINTFYTGDILSNWIKSGENIVSI
jgi:hypothetical protein